MTPSEIINKVREIMNEAGEDENLHLLSEDTVKLDEYIESVIPDAVNLVLLNAPVNCINTSSFSSEIIDNGEGIGEIALPTDFLKLIAVKLKEWKRAVSFVYPFNSEEYKIQHNSITHSGINKPTCVFAFNSIGQIIECIPFGTMEYFYYIKSATNSINKGLDIIKDKLFFSVCYMCAFLVYNIFEMSQTGDKMKSIAIELIPKE
ncbi:hypothetical protein [Parabacteroides provencensis]|uniref:hypothetical protein n=1 Tax=Parabacteroides provencensis TaxID=1944636 RepID=UPI000C14DC60|nr:hypothetical protein [Parabacteroides provencensis]